MRPPPWGTRDNADHQRRTDITVPTRGQLVSEHPTTPTVWRRQLGRRLAILDAIAIGIATLLAYLVRERLGQTELVQELANEVPAALSVLPLWLLILYFTGAYRPEYINSAGDAFRRFTAGTVGGVLALGFLSFLLNLQLSRLFVGLLFAFMFVLGGIIRIGVRRYLVHQFQKGALTQNVLIVGANDEGRELAAVLDGSTDTGYRIVGFLDDKSDTGDHDVPVLGGADDVLQLAQEKAVGLVVVSPSGLRPGTLQNVTLALEGTPIDLAVAPSLFQVVSRRMTVESVANVPLLHVDQIRLQRGKAAIKRTVDITVAAGLLLISLPLAAIAALSIRLEDRGPVLFRQRRVGRDGLPFDMLKFRTMIPDAEGRQAEITELNEVGDKFFKIRDDPRITKVGRLLRRWSIDELPQLWNVLRGDMSMVGPRPALPTEVDQYTDWELRRLRIRPGITGVWQTSGRSNVPFDEAVRLDLFYIENWSLGYDLFLLGKTVVAVLSRRGAF